MSTLREELVALLNEIRPDRPLPLWIMPELNRILAAHPEPEPGANHKYVPVRDLEAFRSVIQLHVLPEPLDSYAEGAIDAYRACQNQIDKFIDGAVSFPSLDAERALCDRLAEALQRMRLSGIHVPDCSQQTESERNIACSCGLTQNRAVVLHSLAAYGKSRETPHLTKS